MARRHPLGYGKYLESDWWTWRKQLYYRAHKRQCAACWKREKFIVLHHLSYDNLYHEPDEDLLPLCRPCHSNVHAVEASGKFRTLREATLYMVERTNKRRSRVQRCTRLPLVGRLFR